MNSQENERWVKRLFGKNGLVLTGISILFLFVYEVGKNIFMDYVLSRLSQHGIVFNKVIEFILDQPFLSSIAFFVLTLSTLLILDYIQFQRRKPVFAINPIPSVQKETPKETVTIRETEKTFKQRQKIAIEEISNLINVAVEKSLAFAECVSYANEPTLGEQCVSTRNSGKELMEYFKSGNNRLYFSNTASKNIIELYELISVCTQKMYFAINGIFQPDLWNEYSEKIKKTRLLRDEIDSEFRELLRNLDEE